MRVLVVLPMYGGSLPIGRYCAAALKELGHLVEVFEAPEFYASYRALKGLRVTTDRLQYLENSYLQVVSQAVLAKTETFRPDLLLSMAQAPLSVNALRRLRRDGVATAMWFVEDYKLFTYWQAYAPHYDFFAVIQKGEFLDALRAAGVAHALYLPLAAQPDVHKPLELSPAQRRTFGSDVSFMGAGYPNRRMAFRDVAARFDFKLWGTDWDGEAVLAPFVQMGGARVSTEDCVRIYNATKVNINLHSSIQARKLVTGGDFVNPRTFEVAACGAFQLVDRRSLMAELFAEDELATFDDAARMSERIGYFLAHPDERLAMAQKARARVLAQHTYAARMRTLLEWIAANRPGWPEKSADVTTAQMTAGMPPELAGEIAALLERLALPPDAAFDDVVWALRQRQGRLDGLDAALLFLDEWRKLYARAAKKD